MFCSSSARCIYVLIIRTYGVVCVIIRVSNVIRISSTERKRLLHKPSVSTLDSEGFSDHESDPVDQTEIESNLTPPPAPVAKSGLAIFCTEIPPPRLLKDNGYVDVVSTHTLKNVISQPFNQKQTSSLALNSEETLRSGTRSPLERLSSRNKDSMESTRSNLTNSITSTHSVELPSLNSSRDVTLSTYDSLPMSPLIPQPLTMQLEDVRKLYYLHTLKCLLTVC